MLQPHLIATPKQQIISLLIKFSDRRFYEREIARTLDISYGSANRSLNELHKTKAVSRIKQGKMYFYSITSPMVPLAELKKMVNLLLIETLVEKLKQVADRVVLYGSCAQGTDTSDSDMDLFVVSQSKEKAFTIIDNFDFPRGYQSIRIQAVIKSPLELLQSGQSEKAFIEEVERGTIVWERMASESGISAMSA